jgi:hypothetical protein
MQAMPRLAAEVATQLITMAPRAQVQRLEREPAEGAFALAIAETRGGARVPAYPRT